MAFNRALYAAKIGTAIDIYAAADHEGLLFLFAPKIVNSFMTVNISTALDLTAVWDGSIIQGIFHLISFIEVFCIYIVHCCCLFVSDRICCRCEHTPLTGLAYLAHLNTVNPSNLPYNSTSRTTLAVTGSNNLL